MNSEQKIKSYKIFAFRNWSIVLYLFIAFLLPLIVFETIMNDDSVLFLVILMVVFNIIAYFLIKEVGLIPIKVYFDNEKITFEYLSRDLKNVKKTKTISMKNINEFSDYSFYGEPTFKLKLPYGYTFRLYKHGLWNRNDDFEILISDFKKFIKDYNFSIDNLTTGQKDTIEPKAIKYNDFFQSQKAKTIFYIAIALVILTAIMVFTKQSENFSSPLIVIGGLLAYIGGYLSKKNKKNK